MSVRPEPGMTVVKADVLSDVLRAVRLTGAVYFDFELSSPWVAEAPPSRAIAETVMPGADRVIEYHLIARGSCWGNAIGQKPIALGEGDVIVFPQGDPHVLSSAPGMRAATDTAIFARGATPLPLVHEFGGGGPDRARVVCCFMGCDERPFNPLLSALPPVIHLRAADAAATLGWLTTVVNIAVNESRSKRAGGENVLARLSELMFVEVIRRHLETLDPVEKGWLAGLRDPVVGQALARRQTGSWQHWYNCEVAVHLPVSLPCHHRAQATCARLLHSARADQASRPRAGSGRVRLGWQHGAGLVPY